MVIDGGVGISGGSLEHVNDRPCWVADVGALWTLATQPRSLITNGEWRTAAA